MNAWFTKTRIRSLNLSPLFSNTLVRQRHEYDLTIDEIMSRDRVRSSNVLNNTTDDHGFISNDYLMVEDGIYRAYGTEYENLNRSCIRCGRQFTFLSKMEHELCEHCTKELYGREPLEDRFENFDRLNKNDLERILEIDTGF